MAMSELDEAALADLRERYRVTVPSTHWHDCYQSHPFCAIARLCDELSAARQEATKAREDAGWAIAWIGKLAVAAGMHDDEGQTTSPEGFAIWLRDQHDGYVETMADLRAARQRIAELEGAASRQQEEIQQTLGRALGYPRLADDQRNFPGATEADGVCVGDHVAESLASEAAKRIAALEGERDEMRDALREVGVFRSDEAGDDGSEWCVTLEPHGVAPVGTLGHALAKLLDAAEYDGKCAATPAAREGE